MSNMDNLIAGHARDLDKHEIHLSPGEDELDVLLAKLDDGSPPDHEIDKDGDFVPIQREPISAPPPETIHEMVARMQKEGFGSRGRDHGPTKRLAAAKLEREEARRAEETMSFLHTGKRYPKTSGTSKSCHSATGEIDIAACPTVDSSASREDSAVDSKVEMITPSDETTTAATTSRELASTSEVTTGNPTTAITSADYQFPGSDPRVLEVKKNLSGCSTPELLAILKRLSFDHEKVTGEVVPYSKIRTFVIAISLLLNEQQRCPPRLREIRTSPYRNKGVKWGEEESALSNDRQVIDIHWLRLANPAIRPLGRWHEIMTCDGVDYVKASEFVRTVGKPSDKIRELGIHDYEIVQLAVIQTPAIKDHWRDIRRRADEGVGRFRGWIEDQRGRTTATVEDLQTDFKILGMLGKEFSKAARLATLVKGTSVPAKVMQRRYELFRRLDLLR